MDKMSQFEEELKRILKLNSFTDETEVDGHLDSIGSMEVIYAVHEIFGKELDGLDYKKFKTVGDLKALI